MAAKGYVVVYSNPRGSTTYGQDFGNSIQHRYPGDDYRRSSWPRSTRSSAAATSTRSASASPEAAAAAC